MVRKSLYWMYKVSLYSVWLFIVLMSASIIGLRYFVLPNIEHYKPKIIAEVSNALGQKVTVDEIKANWDGLNPRIELRNINIYDAENRVALNLAHVETSLSWLSIPLVEPRFSAINIYNPELIIRRETDGTVYVAGVSMSGPSQTAFPNWLLRQSEVNVLDANIVWQDELRGAPSLNLSQLNLLIDNPAWDTLRGHHRFSFKATPSAASSKPIDIRGNVFGKDVGQLNNWHGTLYARIEGTDISAWRQWVDYPFDLREGQGAARLWLDFEDGRIEKMTSDVAFNNVVTRLNFKNEESHFNRLAGRLKWIRHTDGQEFVGERLQVNTPDDLNMENGNFSVRERKTESVQQLEGNIELDEVQLEAINKLTHYFPIPSHSTQILEDVQPQGKLSNLKMSWKNKLDSISEYALKANFSGLGMQAYSKYQLPGFQNLKGSLDINESNGKILFDTQKSTVNFVGVFRWPIPVEKIQGKISWRTDKNKLNIHASQLEIKTPDIEGVIDGHISGTNLQDAYLDLTGHFDHANLKNTKLYLPTILSKDTLDWIDTSILDGTGSDANLIFKGKLSDFPFTNKKGVFRVTAKASNMLLDHSTGWPKIEGINLNMLFEGKRMEINANAGHAIGNKIIKAKISIPDLEEAETKLDIIGEAQGLVSDGVKYVNASPIAKIAGGFTENLKTSGNGKLDLNLHIPLYHLDQSKIKGTYAVSNGSMSSDSIPEITKINGNLNFTDNSINVQNVNVFVYDGPAQFNINTDKSHAIQISAQGHVTDAGVRKSFSLLPNSVIGSTDWFAKAHIQDKKTEFSIRSNLIGISSKLPAPLAKAAEEGMPFLLEKKPTSNTQDIIKANLGSSIGAKIAITNQNGISKIDRGEIGINVTPELSAKKGIVLRGVFSELDMDEWLAQTNKNSASSSHNTFAINQVDLTADRFELFDRRVNMLKLKAKFNDNKWLMNVKSDEVTGDIKWNKEGNGKLTANLSTLLIPSSSNEATKAPVGPAKQLNITYPALDITAENFEIGKKKLGRLELKAQEQSGSWTIEKLRISAPESTLTANGEWNNWKRRPNTSLRFIWEIEDMGKSLKRLNYPDVIKGGSANIVGQLKWAGSPHEFDIPNLSGSLKLDAKKGQILQVEPGVGRLFSVLSLQNLPRRLTLDFKDLFSSGFVFDKITADVKIQQGIMRSDNFKMEGPTARVEIKGETDLDKETQHLYVKATPFISDTLSLAAFAGGPAVGAAAYIAQKILKDPLNKIAETEYEIVGTWSDPQEKESPSKLSIPGSSLFTK